MLDIIHESIVFRCQRKYSDFGIGLRGHDMQPTGKPRTELEILRRGAAQIRARLPTGWTATLQEGSEDPHVDGVMEISAPDLQRATLVLEAKRTIEGRNVEGLRRRLAQSTAEVPNSQAVVIAPYLSRQVRTRLEEAKLSFVDATGNIRIELSRPGLFLSDWGAGKDPWRSPGRPRSNLKGAAAARVVRALADFDKSWRMLDLVQVSGTTTGTTYRVVDHMEREGLVDRDATGMVTATDWRRLLRAWTSDYGLVKNSQTTRWIAPRGLSGLLGRLAEDGNQNTYAVTGTLAAAEWAEYAPASLAMIYVSNAEAAARTWGLHATEAGANVVLAEPQYPVVFERAWANDAHVFMAAASQVYADLATGPGRNPSEAEVLLSWMQRNESAWRRRD